MIPKSTFWFFSLTPESHHLKRDLLVHHVPNVCIGHVEIHWRSLNEFFSWPLTERRRDAASLFATELLQRDLHQ